MNKKKHNSIRIDILPYAYKTGFVGFIIGLFCGILYSFGGLIIDLIVTLEIFSSNETPGLSIGTLLAFGALFVMPIIGAFTFFLFGIVIACIFNLFKNYYPFQE